MTQTVTIGSGNVFADLGLPHPEIEARVADHLDVAIEAYNAAWPAANLIPDSEVVRQRIHRRAMGRALFAALLAESKKPWTAPVVRDGGPRSLAIRTRFGLAEHQCPSCEKWLRVGAYCKGMDCPLNPN